MRKTVFDCALAARELSRAGDFKMSIEGESANSLVSIKKGGRYMLCTQGGPLEPSCKFVTNFEHFS